jgi:hypothetical protein
MMYCTALECAQELFEKLSLGSEIILMGSRDYCLRVRTGGKNLFIHDYKGYNHNFLEMFKSAAEEKKALEDGFPQEDRSYQGEIEYTDKEGVDRHSDMCGNIETLKAMLPSYLSEIVKNADLTKPWKVDGGHFCKSHSGKKDQ